MAIEKTLINKATYESKMDELKAALDNYSNPEAVHLNDTQTITGLKTFATLPQAGTDPSNDADFVPKKYIDDLWATRKAQEEKCYQALKTVTKDFTRTDPVYVRIGDDGEPEIHYTFANETVAVSWFANMSLGDATIYVHNGGSLTSATSIIDGATLKGIVFDDLSQITLVNSNLSNANIKVWKCLGKVKNFQWSAFGGSTNLETLYIGNTSTITALAGAFYECKKLNPSSFSNWDTSNVTEFGRAFDNASKILANLPLIDTSKGEVFDGFLWDRSQNALKSVPAYNLSNGTNLDGLLGYSYQRAVKLEYFHAYGMKASLDLSFTAMKHDAILEVFNNLGSGVAEGTTLTLGATKLALMSDDEKKIATDKGWTLA